MTMTTMTTMTTGARQALGGGVSRRRVSAAAVRDYWLSRWANGELNASDCLDRIREAGADVTLSQYAAMRRYDATGVLA